MGQMSTWVSSEDTEGWISDEELDQNGWANCWGQNKNVVDLWFSDRPLNFLYIFFYANPRLGRGGGNKLSFSRFGIKKIQLNSEKNLYLPPLPSPPPFFFSNHETITQHIYIFFGGPELRVRMTEKGPWSWVQWNPSVKTTSKIEPKWFQKRSGPWWGRSFVSMELRRQGLEKRSGLEF